MKRGCLCLFRGKNLQIFFPCIWRKKITVLSFALFWSASSGSGRPAFLYITLATLFRPASTSFSYIQTDTGHFFAVGKINRGLLWQRQVLILVEQNMESQEEPCISTKGLWESRNTENIKNINYSAILRLYLFCSVFCFFFFCMFTNIIESALKRHPSSCRRVPVSILDS